MTDAVRAAYAHVSAGVRATGPSGRRIAMLVSTTDVSSGREDVLAAAGLGRQLARLGHGVRLVAPEDWYSNEYADGELLVALVPAVDVRRIPAGFAVLAWVRSLVEKWCALPGLEDFAAVLAPSELGRDRLAERYRGPLDLLPVGFDEELFVDTPGAPPAGRHMVTTTKDRDATSVFGRPALYRESVLAVDAVADADVGYGNHDTLLLEALACGSPVATNTPLGLKELGLERVAVHRAPRELKQLADRAKAGEFAALTAELRDIVRAEHGYARRAASFVDFASAHDLWRRPERPDRVINFFPDWRRTNPYQRMLYSRVPDGVRVVASTDPVEHLVLRDDGGDLSGQVLHVHWQNFVLQPSRNHAEATRRLRVVRETLTDMLDRGLKLVWTVHNRMPHEVDYYFHEVELCRFLASRAHVVHVLSEHTLDVVGGLYELDPRKVVVVEHGSYAGVYPELLDRATARERLGLLPSERVALFFGAVRPYKGLEQLVEVFSRIHRSDPATRLLIVGQPGRTMDPAFLARLERLAFVTTMFGFVPESDVHLYFRAADVQVAPYTAVLNSGSVLLGLGFGLPVVAPRLGALQSLAGESFLFPYRAQDGAELEDALRSALDRLRDPALGGQAVDFAERYTGDDMSDTFVRDILDRLLPPTTGRVSERGAAPRGLTTRRTTATDRG